MTELKKLALLSLILLFAFVPMVTAYDTIIGYDFPDLKSAGGGNGPGSVPGMHVINTTFFGNITHINWQGPCYMPSADGGKSMGIIGTDDAPPPNQGYYSATWSASQHTGYGAACEVDIVIHNFTASGTTNPDILYLGGTTPLSLYFNTSGVAPANFGTISSDPHIMALRSATEGAPGHYIIQSGTAAPPIGGISFTASPTFGFTPLLVNFTAATNITPSIVKWNFGDGTISNTSTSALSSFHTYSAVGLYTVRLETYDGTYGWQNFTRSEYITATNPSGVVFNVDIKDSISGALIQDSSVGIRNTTTGVWRNGTAPTGLIYYDTTDPGYLYPLSVNQSVTIAANKTGYQSASLTFSIPYDNYRAFLYLVPSSVVNATGTGTVVATVVRNKDGLPLSGTSVTLSTGQMGVTNSAGAVTLRNVTAGTPTATAINSGYQTTSSTFTLSAGETKMVVIQMVLDGESPVTTYGSPTPTRTPGPGDPGYAGVNTSSGALNERGSTGLMEMMGQLIDLWPLVLIILFMKFMKDAFS